MSDIVERLRSRAWEHREHRKLREEAAQEIERLRAAQAWQPIETAPQNGTVIIAADFGRYDFLERAWWQAEFDAWITSCRQIVMGPGYTINGKSTELHSPTIVRPTHWMPLPKPPEAET